MRQILRGTEDNLYFIHALQRSFAFLTERGFSFSCLLPEKNGGVLLIQFIGPFNMEIERDERLVTAIYLYPLNIDKPLSIKRISIERLIFIVSECTENISGIMPRFWDPAKYQEDAEMVSNKVTEYYKQIEWLMKSENVKLLYDRLNETGREFMRTLN